MSRVILISAVLWILSFAVPCQAQSDAMLFGTLTDPSGAAIAGAQVSADPKQSGARAETRTDAAGNFTLALPAGAYRVRITHTHFARVEQSFTLAAGDRREWSMQLNVEPLSASVIVTAQAEPLAAEQVAVPASVLTREEFEQRQDVFVAAAITATPGVAIGRLGREGGITSLFLNGGNSNFTKVLIDGTPVNEPGGAVDLSNFTLDNIEKIEVIHGASSALFGTDAMTGVVQIFTRRGTTGRPQLELVGEGGRFDTARGLVRLSGLVNRFDYSAAWGRFNTNGQGGNDQFRNTTLSGNFGWRFTDDNRLRLALRSASSDSGVPGQTLLIPLDTDHHNALRDVSVNLAWDFRTGSHWSHRLAGTQAYERQIFHDPASDFCLGTPPFPCDFPFLVRNTFNRAGAQAQSTYVVPRGAVTLGYQLEIENGFAGSAHGHRNNQGGYAEGRWNPASRVVLIGGFRVEGNDSFGIKVVPRVGATFTARNGDGDWGATRLRLSYGHGIKEPSLSQSFVQDACFPGNTTLRPERSRAFNVGAEQLLAEGRLRVSVDFFYNRFRDIVSFGFGQFPGPAPPPATCPFGFGSFFNTDLARARGLNTSAEARVRWFRIHGNYSFTDSRVLQSPNAFDPALIAGQRLLRRPVHSGNLILNFDYRRMNWNVASHFVGPRTDSDFLGFGLSSNHGYARVDLAAHYALPHGLTAFGRIENLFDKQYQEVLGYPAYRRGYRLGMKFLWGGE